MRTRYGRSSSGFEGGSGQISKVPSAIYDAHNLYGGDPAFIRIRMSLVEDEIWPLDIRTRVVGRMSGRRGPSLG